MLHLPTLAFCHSVVFASVDDDDGVNDGNAWLQRKRKWSLEGNELEKEGMGISWRLGETFWTEKSVSVVPLGVV